MITVHILLMDENPIFSDLLSELLEEELNVQVTAPGTFLVDVAEIERLHPDLILMALRRDGTALRLWTCVQHLKSYQATKDIPVVLYDGYWLDIVDLVLEQEPILPWKSNPSDNNLVEFASRIRQLVADLPGK
jgi:CheY-like chemotaxis protein